MKDDKLIAAARTGLARCVQTIQHMPQAQPRHTELTTAAILGGGRGFKAEARPG